MKNKATPEQGSVTDPQGFLAGGVFCDIKRLGTGTGSNKGRKRDLAIILSEVPAAVAGLFTTNQVCAAPVKVCIPRVAAGTAQAIVVNSGNANACTGRQGLQDALAMTRQVARHLHLPDAHVLVASTGRIGLPLPMPNIRKGIAHALRELADTRPAAARAAEAILTSDTRPKQAVVKCRIGGQTITIGGICKGAGMIQPGMSRDGRRPAAAPRGLHATMLCFLTSDVAIDSGLLQACLEEAVALSFNRITVDGDMSTNDTVLLLANGMAGNKPLQARGTRPGERRAFQAALNRICLDLAQMIVRDGEGVHRRVTVRVSGARSEREADAAARSVANSALVKTSWHGGDPNWGRIIDALGYSSAKVIEEQTDIGYSAPGQKKILWSLRRGRPTAAGFRALCRAVAADEFDLHIRLNLGKGSATLISADLTEAYVEFNKGDVGDPAALGG